MEKISLGGLERSAADEAMGRWRLSEPLGATNFAINRYQLTPGEGLPGGVHAHMDQEEVFVVLDGAATFETMNGEITVESGEVVRFASGEFQSGRNDGESDCVLLALGAPRETEDVRIPVDCPDCDAADLRFEMESGVFVCPACGTEYVPTPCPECGSESLDVTLDGGEPTVVCQDCDARYDRPPMED